MNMKLTGLRDLLGPPQIREGLVITSFLKKIRLMRKKCSVKLRNCRIFYPFPRLKMLKKCIELTF